MQEPMWAQIIYYLSTWTLRVIIRGSVMLDPPPKNHNFDAGLRIETGDCNQRCKFAPLMFVSLGLGSQTPGYKS